MNNSGNKAISNLESPEFPKKGSMVCFSRTLFKSLSPKYVVYNENKSVHSLVKERCAR